jgi:hypothetical protein
MPQQISQYYRFCPDQPKVLISDAVCRSRRRVRYPWCAGCRFNDDEKGPKGERAAGAAPPDASAPGDRAPHEPKTPKRVQIELDTKPPEGAEATPRHDRPAKDA